MDSTRRKRIGLRLTVMIVTAVLLAILPPMLLKTPVMDAFPFGDESQYTANAYTDLMRWCHLGGIAALTILNLLFFRANEKKGDSGIVLRKRNALQSWLNFLLIVLTLGVMIGCSLSIVSIMEIAVLLYGTFYSIATVLSPYLVFTAAGCCLWCLCMRSVPATNCQVRGPIMRKIDENIKRKSQLRG